MRSDTTRAGHRDLTAIYGGVRSRIVELFIGRPESCADTPVPTLKDTTVREVLIHLIEHTSDLVPALTPSQYRTAATASELVGVWGRAADDVCGSSVPDDVMSRLVADAAMSEQDLRTALDVPGARDDAAVKVALDELAGRFSDRVAAAGLPSLRVTVEQWGTIAGDGPATACVVADRFEFVRAMSGRRSAAEISRWNWSGDPQPYLAVIAETGLPIAEVRERDPRVPAHMRDREFVL
jgi:hypothetical protein